MQLDEHTSLELANIEEIDNSFSLRNVLRILFRHKWKAMIFFISTVVIMTVYMLLKPDIYESQAQLLVKAGRENISWDASALGSNVDMNRKSDLNVELVILASGFIAAQVVDKIGPETLLVRSYDAPSETLRLLAIKQLMENLTIGTQKSSQIIQLGFQAQSPRLARDVLDSVIDFYTERRIKVHQAEVTLEFFHKQSEILSTKLLQREEQLRQFCDKHGIVSIGGQKEIFLGQVSDINSGIDDTDSQIIFSQGRIAWFEKKLQGSSGITEISRVTGMSNPVADSIKQRLVDLRFREVELANRHLDGSRVLIELRKQISFAEAELLKEQETNTELTTGIDVNYQAIQLGLEQEQAQLQALIAQKQFLKKTLEKRKADLVTLQSKEVKWTNLQRDVDIAKAEYLQYRDVYHRAKISAGLDAGKISNVNIIQPATMPFEPVKSKKRRNIALGVLMGLFGAVGLAYVREFLDDSVKTNEDVKKRLGLPVLITVSYKEVERS